MRRLDSGNWGLSHWGRPKPFRPVHRGVLKPSLSSVLVSRNPFLVLVVAMACLVSCRVLETKERSYPNGLAFSYLEQHFHFTLRPELLDSLRVSIEIEPWQGLDSARAESLRLGAFLALMAWASVLPDLNPSLVPADADPPPDLRFRFADFNRPRQPECCRTPFDWSGYSSWPTAAGGPTRNEVYFNTQGRASFGFEEYHYLSRSQVYGRYRPASYPPEYYHGEKGMDSTNRGFREGRFLDPTGIRLPGLDIFTLALHEFGHNLGIRHRRTTAQECREWYAGPGEEPPRILNTLYKDLPKSYIGGGSYNPLTGSLDSLPVVRPRGDSPLAMTHRLGAPWDCPALEPGIPIPPAASYNNRVLFADDVAELPPHLRSIYPSSRAAIVLAKPEGDTVRVRDWKDAIELAQLDRDNQEDPYFVLDLEFEPLEGVDGQLQ